MLYSSAYGKVWTIFRKHSSCFNDAFKNSLALVGGFDAVEKMNVAGGNRFCGKTMTIRICVEKNAGVAKRLRRGERAV